jgi:hypothetical protein
MDISNEELRAALSALNKTVTPENKKSLENIKCTLKRLPSTYQIKIEDKPMNLGINLPLL